MKSKKRLKRRRVLIVWDEETPEQQVKILAQQQHDREKGEFHETN